MQQLHQWLAAQFALKQVEPNSSLGKAITYLLRHWKGLTAFLREAGAPLDNNVCERALKRAVLHRKNALFYRTLHGAEAGDLFMSLIHTCELAGANRSITSPSCRGIPRSWQPTRRHGRPGITLKRWPKLEYDNPGWPERILFRPRWEVIQQALRRLLSQNRFAVGFRPGPSEENRAAGFNAHVLLASINVESPERESISKASEGPSDVWCWSRCLAVVLLALSAGRLMAGIQANGQQLTIDTTTLTAVFRGADLIQLTNKSTGESYIRTPSSSSLLDLQSMQPTDGPLPGATWSISSGSATASFSQGPRTATVSVNIDPQTQEVVLSIGGQSQQPGVTGLLWGIAGVDLSGGRLVLPSQGGNYLDLAHLQNVSIQYPTSWAVQMAMFEGAQGGFLVYSTDTTFQWKDLIISSNGNSTANVQLKIEAPGPWPSATTVAPIEWRLTVFSGDWRAGATVYKNWMQNQWPPVQATGPRSWVNSVQAAVSIEGLPANSYLDSLAALLDPSKTILMLTGWRQFGFDQNYPNYTPAPGVKSLVDHAHALGFRVDLHVNAIGVSPNHPSFPSVQQYQMKFPDTLAPDGWLWTSPPSTPTRFAFINPAASAFRNLLIDNIGVAIQALGPDAIHLDSTPGMINDGNGLIEGRNDTQGLVELHRELVAAYPNIVLETEGIAEPSVPYCWMAQRWNGWYSYLPSHPVSTFILTDNLHLYGHLNQPNPGQPGFLSWMKQYEGQGVIPLLHMDAVQRATEPSFARTFGQIRYFQQSDLKPDWTGEWKSVLFRYRGSNASTAIVSDSGTLITLQGAQGPIYQRVHGTTTIQTSSFIFGWPAFDADRLYGLDPTVEYWLDQLPRPSGTMHLNSLPPNVVLGENTHVDNSTASVSLLNLSAPNFDFFAGLSSAQIGTDANGQIGPPVSTELTQLSVGGEVRQVIFEHPPDPGSESFIDYAIPVPSGSQTVLQFAVGISDQSARTDPVTFRITVDGEEVWRQDVVKGSWLPGILDLMPNAGRTIHLRLLTNVNAFHDNFAAWAAWSALTLVGNSPVPLISLNVTLPPNAEVSSLEGSGQLQLAPGTATIQNASLAGNFLLSLKPDNPLVSGQSLLNLAFSQYYAEPGELPVAAYYNFPTTVGSGTSNGVTKSPVLIIHPANYGRTIHAWKVQLPKSVPLQFSFSSGLLDDSPNPNGETFEVAVNGIVAWQHNTSAFGWVDGSIDLSALQGQNVYLELIEDSAYSGFYVGTLWAGLQFTVLPTASSTITLSPTSANVGANGGTGSVSVTTTPAGVNWTSASNVVWIEITSGISGLGNGAVSYLVAANPSSNQRTGTLTIAGQIVTVTQAGATETTPTITSVNTADGGSDIAQNDWIVIKGTNLVPASTPSTDVTWSSAPEFASGRMPTELNGVSVTVNGKPAYVYFFCSAQTSKVCQTDQINVLTPLDSTLGPVQIVVNNGTSPSAPFPSYIGIVSTALLRYGTNGYVVATHANSSLIGPSSLYPGYSTPAQPGESIVLYGVGFGIPSTPLVDGASSQSGVLPSSVACQIGNAQASVTFAGLISPGLYQFNVTVPTTGLGDGDNAVTCTYRGASIPPGALIAIQQ
jgi:uncharacterized protein (TIGR03437 family)